MSMTWLELCESTADIYTTTYTHDAVGGRVRYRVKSGSALPCSIQPTSSGRMLDHGQEGQSTTYDVLFPSDPSVSVDDEIHPLDSDGADTGRILMVRSVASNEGGGSVGWIVTAVERQG